MDDKTVNTALPPSVELQSLIDCHEQAFVVIDVAYRVVAANAAYRRSYGEEVVGRLCHEVSHHSPVPCHLNGEDCPHRQVFESGLPHQVLHTHYDAANVPEHVRIQGHVLNGADGARYLGEAIEPLVDPVHVALPGMRMVGQSPPFLKCLDRLGRVAESDGPVLILGESGVGKELAARYVHQCSPRRGRPFVTLNCAAIPEGMFESELFGHERGAYTGSVARKKGLFELADGGTLFLDEVAEIPRPFQAKFLRVLESGEFRRMGGTELLRADVRIVSATNQDLLEMSERGLYRLDLYYRIAGLDVELPPLRARKSDIPLLAQWLMQQLNRSGQARHRLSEEALEKLMDYSYPGNVRELRNLLMKAAALSPGGTIEEDHIVLPTYANTARASQAQPAASASLEEVTRQHLRELLARHGGNRRLAAGELGVSERTLYRKISKYGLD